MRPIFFGASLNPPTMDVLFPAESRRESYRIVRGVRIRAAVATLEEASTAALAELRGFTPEQVALLHEISVPVSRETLVRDDVPAFAVDIAERASAITGPVYCPACCRKLGTADSPHLGYIWHCPGCKRSLTIEFDEHGFRIIVGPAA